VPDGPDRPGIPAGRTRRIGRAEDVVTDQPLTLADSFQPADLLIRAG
jgi:hypothetical protein